MSSLHLLLCHLFSFSLSLVAIPLLLLSIYCHFFGQCVQPIFMMSLTSVFFRISVHSIPSLIEICSIHSYSCNECCDFDFDFYCFNPIEVIQASLHIQTSSLTFVDINSEAMMDVPLPHNGDHTSRLLAGPLDQLLALLDLHVDMAAVSIAVTAGGETTMDVVNVSYL